MNQTLLLKNSNIFENSNLIDRIRQSCFDINENSNENEIRDFLSEAFELFEEEISNDVAIELFSAVLSCFSHYSQQLTNEINILLKKSRMNANYILISSSLIFYLNQNQPQLLTQECHSFINDALKEISDQINLISSNGLIVFGHRISSTFINGFINILLLSSKLESNTVTKVFPYILNQNIVSKNAKFDLLFENIFNCGLIQIFPQDDASNKQIFEFITNKDFEQILSMNESAFSLVEAAIYCANSEWNHKIEGITEETILPFIVIIMIYLEKSQKTLSYNLFQNYKDMIINSLIFYANNQSLVNNKSIDLILQNQFKVSNKQIITNDDMFHIFFVLTQNLITYQYNANRMILLNSIFRLTSLDNYEMLSIFFNEFTQNFEATDLFNYILANFDEINKSDDLIQSKLNLMYIESSMIANYLSQFTTTNDVINFIKFLEKLCCNQPIIVSSPEISDVLMKSIREKVKEENWDDVLVIGGFLKKNDFSNELFELNELEVPKSIKYTLFNTILDENCSKEDEVDHLLSIILNDPKIETNDLAFKQLFELMIKDQEILQCYLTYLVIQYSHQIKNIKVTTENMLKYLKKEYDLYSETLVDIINNAFYINQKNNQLMKKENILSSLPISKFGQTIIFKLFDSIKKKPGNYEAFICLKHISSSFPFLFNNLFDQMCDIVSSNLKSTDHFVENVDSEEDFRIIKTTYSAMTFFVSTLQSSLIMDQFIKWFFNNMETMNDDQLFGYWIIIYYQLKIDSTYVIFNVWAMKLNMMEKIGKILERNPVNTKKLNIIKQIIHLFITKFYNDMDKMNKYIIIQNDEFLNKVENPSNFLYDSIFFKIPHHFQTFDLSIKDVPDQLNQFIKNVEVKRDFWIDYQRNFEQMPNPTTDEYNKFDEKLMKYEPLADLPDLQNIRSKMTIKMVRYVVLRMDNYYTWILYKNEYPFVNENKEKIEEIINDLTKLQNEAKENPDDEENKDIELFNDYDYLLPFYCQQTLFRSLVRDLTNPKFISNANEILIDLISKISENEVSFLSFLEFISQYFNEINDKCNYVNIETSIEAMIGLINALIKLSGIKGFKENFVDLCGNNIINIILKPQLRSHSKLIMKVADLFLIIGSELPIRVTQLICIMLSFNDTSIDENSAFELIKRFDYKQVNNIKRHIFNDFDRKRENLKTSSLFIKFAKIFPSVIHEKNDELLSLLDDILQNYFAQNDDFEISKDISSLIDILAPKRLNLSNNILKRDNIITVPNEIKETSPTFWSLFDKYSKKIIETIENNPYVLDNFKFLCEYPELIPFKIRSSYFRKKMKSRIDQYGRFPLNVDRNNILSSSYKGFFGKANTQILKNLCINFNGEQSIDAGGPTREWFTILSKEIMNQNYGLFECSKNSKSYQPNRFSDINPNHIEYFKFAGKFIARALIEGQCIDCHFTSSFYKQILKCELSYKDVEDFDEELYKNLDWMLHNDVDSLCMFFEIDTKELGIVKTIELKENGSETKVTNENKVEYVNLRANYAIKGPIEQQVSAFCNGFYSLIDYDDIKMFTPKELDLLICGIPEINPRDFIEHTRIDHPYNSDSPVIKYFFDAISKWENEKLAKLLLFMTGSSRVPSNGFKEFCEMTGSPLKISFGGDKSRIPQSHTCFNTIDLPQYESEEELNEKLILAIEECNTFEMS